MKTIARILEDHENSGRYFEVGELRSFRLDKGDGEAVVCLHGVPASAYLYRKLVPALASRGLRGIAFLKIMKGFELNSEVRDLCHAAVSSHHYPVQLIWGMKDRALKFKKHGKRIMEVAGLKDVTRLPGKHFLQEDCFDDIAQQIARFVSPS